MDYIDRGWFDEEFNPDIREWFDDDLVVPSSGAITGTLSRTNANDTCAAAGTQTQVGTLARTNANDTPAAAGTQTQVGTLARTNANDTCAASGSVGGEAAATALRAGGAKKKGKKRYIWIGEDIASLIDGEEPEIVPDVETTMPSEAPAEAPHFEEIRQVARAHQQEAAVMKMFKQQDYSLMLALYAKLLEEEDDIETLLMLL